jgi:hypothetical protein
MTLPLTNRYEVFTLVFIHFCELNAYNDPQEELLLSPINEKYRVHF